MKSRALASIALGAAIMLGATGCSMISPQATTLHYSAAEGINVPDSSGPVQIRNAFFVVGEDDTANLVAAFINPTDKDATVTVAIEDHATPLTVKVPAGQTVSYGVDQELTVEGFTVPIGSTATVAFTSGDGESATEEVPVLDGSLDYLKGAVPTPTPTPEVTKTPEAPTPTSTPTSTESSEG
ncbi:hypothetical protein [Microbacterium gorillae]|uniref:hypothetical protein n=1 Tax=Microbacterium gorillae TaxID=1231063 RepID=UPI00058FD898|nr:hypothetical protein [Microbacterium gorillae]